MRLSFVRARVGREGARRSPGGFRRPFAGAAVGALLVSLLGVAGPASLTAPARAASLTEVTGFGSNPGNLRMFRYVPDGLPAGRPLVV
ncbi:esterase, partial [Streptomyces albidoflavus]